MCDCSYANNGRVTDTPEYLPVLSGKNKDKNNDALQICTVITVITVFFIEYPAYKIIRCSRV